MKDTDLQFVEVWLYKFCIIFFIYFVFWYSRRRILKFVEVWLYPNVFILNTERYRLWNSWRFACIDLFILKILLLKKTNLHLIWNSWKFDFENFVKIYWLFYWRKRICIWLIKCSAFDLHLIWNSWKFDSENFVKIYWLCNSILVPELRQADLFVLEILGAIVLSHLLFFSQVFVKLHPIVWFHFVWFSFWFHQNFLSLGENLF